MTHSKSMMIVSIVTVAAALAATVPTALASDDCDALAAKLTATHSNMTVDRRTEANVILFRYPPLGGFSILCPNIPTENPALTVSVDSAYPTAAFWAASAALGTVVTGAATNDIRSGAQHCQQLALKSANELAETRSAGIKFECQAFTRDGGGAFITIYKSTE